MLKTVLCGTVYGHHPMATAIRRSVEAGCMGGRCLLSCSASSFIMVIVPAGREGAREIRCMIGMNKCNVYVLRYDNANERRIYIL